VTENPAQTTVTAIRGGASENGWLQVMGTQLCNQQGEPVVLRGMSSHGMQWYGQFAGSYSIGKTGALGANVFRVAMYTGEGGYLSDPAGMKAKVLSAVDAAIANDMYVILDWHILSDGNPQTHKAEAKAFFAEMAERYKDTPNLLYEVCNEPNGNVSWAGDIKPYEEELVAVIREHSPRAVILLGSSTWSQDLHLAAQSPVEGENLMYTLHFYAGTHGQELRSRIDAALAAGLPVFVSEWGTSRADGGGGVFSAETETWLDFLNQRGISWCNWSLCDKNESSAALNPGASPENWDESDLSPSGKLVFSHFAD
jgi:endoglucanase